jgi:hypothetical protein
MSFIYIVGSAGALSGPVTLPVVPGVGVQVPENAIELADLLPPCDPAFAWALVDGEPVQLMNRRGLVYQTETGAALEWAALGDLPDEVTSTPFPGPYHVWRLGAWVLDKEAKLEADKSIERDWRTAQISNTDYVAMPDYPITDERRSELYTYRQALRDWPQLSSFPEATERPSQPAWLMDILNTEGRL